MRDAASLFRCVRRGVLDSELTRRRRATCGCLTRHSAAGTADVSRAGSVRRAHALTRDDAANSAATSTNASGQAGRVGDEADQRRAEQQAGVGDGRDGGERDARRDAGDAPAPLNSTGTMFAAPMPTTMKPASAAQRRGHERHGEESGRGERAADRRASRSGAEPMGHARRRSAGTTVIATENTA